MDNSPLQTAYSAEAFRKQGHQLIDVLADHLDSHLSEKSNKTLRWHDPETEREFWRYFLLHGDETALFREVIQRTTNVHSTQCIGHQVAAPAPITALSAMVSALLNNGMAVYEMGMAPSAIERIITDFLCEKIGYDTKARGFLTSGGTLANLTALLSARKAMLDTDIWNEGQNSSLGIMVSEEAHYCIDRAARIMGLGEKGIIKIPTTDSYQMNISLLESALEKAKKNGITVFAIVGSAPSTATGIYDDLVAIGQFSKRHQLWFHVDGAHGGAALFSEKYRYTVKGMDHADSVVIDGHKMMMMPATTTALLFKNGAHSYATFSQKADYLLSQSEDEDWYNLAKRTFECTKNMMSLHWYTLLKTYGEAIFEENVNVLYDLGHTFGDYIKDDPNFELAVVPVSNIVCFRYVEDGLSTETLNTVNAKVRQQLIEEGEFYIVQTKLRGIQYLRCTVMNPFTTPVHFMKLLANIKNKATTLTLQMQIKF